MQIKHSVTVNSQKKSRKTLLIGIKRLKRVASLSCQFEMTRNLQKAKLSQEKKICLCLPPIKIRGAEPGHLSWP